MIAIPNPCSEDFSKMTPTEKGAFCNKCSTDTYDFRNLNNPQILEIVAKNKGEKMCGQFKNTQLIELNNGFEEWKKQTPRTFRSKFIFAVLLGFGLTLFSCTEEKEIVQNELKHIEQIVEATPSTNFINEETNVTELDLRNYIDTTYIQEIEPEILQYLDYEIGGAVSSEYDYPIVQEYVTAGVPIISDEFEIYATELNIEVIDSADSETTLPTKIIPLEFESKVFPNPSKGFTTVEIEVKESDEFSVSVYDLKGNLVKQIFSGVLESGQKRFELDLSNENSGMYLVRIISSTYSETLKVQRVN